MLFLAVAGCVATSNDSDCVFTLEAPKAGSSYDYDASGRFATPAMNYAYVHWGSIESGGMQEMLDLKAGSSVRVEISAATEPRLDIIGRTRPAWQVDYFADAKGHESTVRFLTEWIDAEIGVLTMGALIRPQVAEDGSPVHLAQFGRSHRPPVIAASALWGQELASGMNWSFSLPMPRFNGAMGEYAPGKISYEVQRMVHEGASCMAEVAIEYVAPELPQQAPRLLMLFKEGTALPVEVKETTEERVWPALELVLRQAHQPEGASLPNWRQPPGYEDGAWPIAPSRSAPVDGFLPGGGDVFDTSYSEAVAAMRNDSTVAAWLAQHPTARPQTVRHSLGAPDSAVVDEWGVNWVDSQGVSRFVRVIRERPVLDLLPPPALKVTMDTQDGTEDENSKLGQLVVNLDLLASLHQTYYGQRIEVVDCWLPQAQCSIGTHESLQLGYASGGGTAGFPLTGLSIDVNRGWILQEGSPVAAVVA